ncbi:recombinase family protein [Kitasatospora sp. NPDC092286]|uniref:recombinase family protein n=1 Tax=Kitasatospora sp. NPDC092286 TaxID=3364087 RepID=UPI0037F34F3D
MEDPVVLEEQAGTSSRLHPLERPKFGELLAYARPGDTVHISEMFRLVRGTGHILDVLDVLHRDQVALRIHDGAFSAMDPSSSSAASPSTAPRAPQRSQLSARRAASTRTASPPSRATPCSESSGLQDHPLAGFRRIWVMPRDPRGFRETEGPSARTHGSTGVRQADGPVGSDETRGWSDPKGFRCDVGLDILGL